MSAAALGISSSDAVSVHSMRERFGIYHWPQVRAGVFNPEAESITARALLSATGTQSIRFQLGPRCDVASLNGRDITLSSLLKSFGAAHLLADPRWSTVMITAFDGASLGDCSDPIRYVRLASMTTELQQQIEEEYYRFAKDLLTQFPVGKTFYISNWETDNAIYCSASWAFATDEKFRNECLENYPKWYYGNTGPEQSFEALRLWFSARQKGIARARKDAALDDPHASRIYHAPEICIVDALQRAGLPSVLNDILLRDGNFDLVSYSAWEGVNQGSEVLKRHLDVIGSTLQIGNERIIIGELGVDFGPKIAGEAEALRRLAQFVQLLAVEKVQQSYVWSLKDPAGSTTLGWTQGGVFREDGSCRPHALWWGGDLSSCERR